MRLLKKPWCDSFLFSLRAASTFWQANGRSSSESVLSMKSRRKERASHPSLINRVRHFYYMLPTLESGCSSSLPKKLSRSLLNKSSSHFASVIEFKRYTLYNQPGHFFMRSALASKREQSTSHWEAHGEPLFVSERPVSDTGHFLAFDFPVKNTLCWGDFLLPAPDYFVTFLYNFSSPFLKAYISCQSEMI